jgi:hypothetical protein
MLANPSYISKGNIGHELARVRIIIEIIAIPVAKHSIDSTGEG